MRTKQPTVFQVPAGVLVEALMLRAIEHGSSTKGTYNRQDPTAFTKASVYITAQYDPFFLRDYKWTDDMGQPVPDNCMPPPPGSCYRLDINDVCWGVEVQLTFISSEADDPSVMASFANHVAIQFYYDRDDKEIIDRGAEICGMEEIQKFLISAVSGGFEFSNEAKDWEEEEYPSLGNYI